MAYVSLTTLRALPNLSDTAKFTDAELTAAISWFEVTFEDYTGVAWETRTVTAERHYDPGTEVLLNKWPARTISAVRAFSTATTSTPYTAAELADLRLDPTGPISRTTLGSFQSAFGLIEVDYTHGYTTTAPTDIVEAAKVAIRDRLLTDNTGNRVYAVSTDAGIIRQSTPGPRTPFGIPSVDEVANRRSMRVPGLA